MYKVFKKKGNLTKYFELLDQEEKIRNKKAELLIKIKYDFVKFCRDRMKK